MLYWQWCTLTKVTTSATVNKINVPNTRSGVLKKKNDPDTKDKNMLMKWRYPYIWEVFPSMSRFVFL